jgi:hypothetical protein
MALNVIPGVEISRQFLFCCNILKKNMKIKCFHCLKVMGLCPNVEREKGGEREMVEERLLFGKNKF